MKIVLSFGKEDENHKHMECFLLLMMLLMRWEVGGTAINTLSKWLYFTYYLTTAVCCCGWGGCCCGCGWPMYGP